MKGRFVPQSLWVVKCCFLYVPTLTELSRCRLNECFYSQIPSESDGGGWSRISEPHVRTMHCCSPSLQPLHTAVWMQVCGWLWLSLLYTSVSDMFPAGTPETPEEEQLQNELSFMRNTIARKTSRIADEQTLSQTLWSISDESCQSWASLFVMVSLMQTDMLLSGLSCLS